MIILVLLMVCLSACAPEEENTEEENTVVSFDMMSDTEKKEYVDALPRLDLVLMSAMIEENAAQAQLMYDNKTFLVYTIVEVINTDCYLQYGDAYKKSLKVCLPTLELAMLSKGKVLAVMGTLTDINECPTIIDAVNVTNYAGSMFSDEELQYAINNFGGDGGDGIISWTEGSYPFFMENREYFEMARTAEIIESFSGKWNAFYYRDGQEVPYTIDFIDEFNAKVYQGGKYPQEKDWRCLIGLDTFLFPVEWGSYRVRRVTKDFYVCYREDQYPEWIFYR